MVFVLGKHIIALVSDVNEFIDLVFRTFLSIFTMPFRFKNFIKQLYFVANQSFVIVAFCVTFAAMVIIIESSFHMKLVIQNDSMVPSFASLLILRELGSVIAALLITSRVGAGLAAEVGIMKVTEQIDALKMLGIDPIKYLVVPRFLACILGVFILSILSNIICILGAMGISILKLGYTAGSFFTAMRTFVRFQDLVFASIKGACFGAIIPLVSCYYGFRCKDGAEGVGTVTTQSVVTSSVGIIVLDFILGWIFAHFY